jgi:hypothetical protein
MIKDPFIIWAIILLAINMFGFIALMSKIIYDIRKMRKEESGQC